MPCSKFWFRHGLGPRRRRGPVGDGGPGGRCAACCLYKVFFNFFTATLLLPHPGLFPSSQRVNVFNTPQTSDFVTAVLKGAPDGFALKAGDAQRHGGLKTMYIGPRPVGYEKMRLQGAIILGIGGDNRRGVCASLQRDDGSILSLHPSNFAVGSFYEGYIAQGFTSDAADEAVHASVVAAGYKMFPK